MFNMRLKQWSYKFVDLMKNRVLMGFFRYGFVQDARLCDWLKFAKLKIQKYENTGNQEYLIDAANYLMFEFQFPSRYDVYFECDNREGDPVKRVIK